LLLPTRLIRIVGGKGGGRGGGWQPAKKQCAHQAQPMTDPHGGKKRGGGHHWGEGEGIPILLREGGGPWVNVWTSIKTVEGGGEVFGEDSALGKEGGIDRFRL